MKTPFRGELKGFQTNIPDSLKKEMFHDSSPRYCQIALPKPIHQDGQDFSFMVTGVKMTPELELQPHGRPVLCQTKAEADESVKLLTEAAREHMVCFQSGNIGSVGFVQPGGRGTITEHKAGAVAFPDGKRVWLAIERDIDKATGEITVKRRQEAATEQEAVKIYQQWLAEYNQGKQNYLDAVAKSKIAPVPADSFRCDTLTTTDMDDAGKARMAVLRRQWPHCFEIFDNRNAGRNYSIDECRKAYVLDWAEQGENPLDVRKEIPADADMEFWNALKKASDRAAKSKRKLLLQKVDYLIAFNWHSGWCYLADKELAEKISASLSCKFTPGQIGQRRYNLGLVAKHHSGPPPESDKAEKA